MKTLYFCITYVLVLMLFTSCAAMIEALEDEDWSLIGANMHQTGRTIQQENEASKNAQTVNQQQQQMPLGTTCMNQLVRDPVYGHYESLMVCR